MNLQESKRLDAWIRDRVLWRARKLNLSSHGVIFINDLSAYPEIVGLVNSRLKGSPVLLFTSSRDFWTVLTTREIISFHGQRVHYCELSSVAKMIDIYERHLHSRPKQTAEILEISPDRALIWAASGHQFSGLWSILLMFPITLPS